MTRDELIREIAFPIWQRRLWENGWGQVEDHPREKFEDSWKSWETADELIKDGMTIAHAIANAELALSAIEAAGVTLCPNEPTEAMKKEGADYLPVTPGGATTRAAANVYEAMLSASPLKQGGTNERTC